MLQKLPAAPERIETGPLQIGEDWPGVFFRGDNSSFFAFSLASKAADVAKTTGDPMILSLCYDIVKHAQTLAEADSKGLTQKAISEYAGVVTKRCKELDVDLFSFI